MVFWWLVKVRVMWCIICFRVMFWCELLRLVVFRFMLWCRVWMWFLMFGCKCCLRIVWFCCLSLLSVSMCRCMCLFVWRWIIVVSFLMLCCWMNCLLYWMCFVFLLVLCVVCRVWWWESMLWGIFR